MGSSKLTRLLLKQRKRKGFVSNFSKHAALLAQLSSDGAAGNLSADTVYSTQVSQLKSHGGPDPENYVGNWLNYFYTLRPGVDYPVAIAALALCATTASHHHITMEDAVKQGLAQL